MLDAVGGAVPPARLAVHCHDTRGMGIANVYACVQAGITVVDASVAGPRRLPVRTGRERQRRDRRDVVWLLDGLGVHTGVDLVKLAETGQWISDRLGRPNGSRAGCALLAALRH